METAEKTPAQPLFGVLTEFKLISRMTKNDTVIAGSALQQAFAAATGNFRPF